MHEARLFHLQQRVRIYPQSGADLTCLDAFLLLLVRFRQRVIWERAGRRLRKQCDTFSREMGADPFGARSRVEILVRGPMTGRWTMNIFWNPDHEHWAGMHLSIEFVLDWPVACNTVS
jgi:hypothetical protein